MGGKVDIGFHSGSLEIRVQSPDLRQKTELWQKEYERFLVQGLIGRTYTKGFAFLSARGPFKSTQNIFHRSTCSVHTHICPYT